MTSFLPDFHVCRATHGKTHLEATCCSVGGVAAGAACVVGGGVAPTMIKPSTRCCTR